MFLGIEIALADLLIGGGLGVLFLALLLMFRREQTESNYQKSLVDAFKNLANSHWDSAEQEHRRADFLTEKVIELVDEVADVTDALTVAEDCLEEVEEELDDLEESANEALAGWKQADEISTRALAWGERVLGLLEQAEGERL